MAASIVAGEARFVVRLDTGDAERRADALDSALGTARRAPDAPTAPPRTNPGGDGANRPGKGKDAPFDPVEHGKELARGVWGGGLYDKVTAAVGAIPIAGPQLLGGIRLGELNAEHGPAMFAGLNAFASSIQDPATRSAIQALAAQMKGAEAISRGAAALADEVKATLDTIGQTVQETKDLAIGAAALGGADSTKLAGFGADLYSINRYQAEGEALRKRRSRAFLGQALGEAGGAALNQMFGGRSGR